MKKLKKLLAYIYMPIIFTFICTFTLAYALSPFFDIATSLANLIVTSEAMSANGSDGTFFEITDIHDGYISLNDLTLPAYGEHYAHLSIERIGLETPVYYGDDYGVLRVGAGQYVASIFPGFKGTTLLAGHNTRVFRPLRDVEVGDIVSFQTSYGNFEYQITQLQVVHESEYNRYLNLSQTEKDMLLMYTCYPFDGLVGVSKERLFVFAEKISGPTIRNGDVNE